jgi:PAS domain-containing protein
VTERWDFASAAQLADDLPDGIVVVDAAGMIVSVNTRLLELIGYQEDALVGPSIDKLVPADRRTAHGEHRTAFSAHPVVRPMGARLDIAAACSDPDPSRNGRLLEPSAVA